MKIIKVRKIKPWYLSFVSIVSKNYSHCKLNEKHLLLQVYINLPDDKQLSEGDHQHNNISPISKNISLLFDQRISTDRTRTDILKVSVFQGCSLFSIQWGVILLFQFLQAIFDCRAFRTTILMIYKIWCTKTKNDRSSFHLTFYEHIISIVTHWLLISLELIKQTMKYICSNREYMHGKCIRHFSIRDDSFLSVIGFSLLR